LIPDDKGCPLTSIGFYNRMGRNPLLLRIRQLEAIFLVGYTAQPFVTKSLEFFICNKSHAFRQYPGKGVISFGYSYVQGHGASFLDTDIPSHL